MSIASLALIVVGAFYVFAGVVGTRATLTSHMLDRALAGISGTAVAGATRAKALWLIVASNVILAGGLALALRLDMATWLFLASAIGQGLYLGVIAPRYFDAADPPDASGRKGTRNAFVLYCAATLLVAWAHVMGLLMPWREISPWLLAAAAAACGGHLAYGLWFLAMAGRNRGRSD